MSYSTKKGADGEREAAEFFNNLVKPEYHICRIGGVEFRKASYAGDISIINSCRKHGFRGQNDPTNSIFYDIFFEVKTRANPNIWKAMEKAEDDSKLSNKSGVIGYFIKQKKGEKGERLICLRPETFNRIYKR